MSPVQMKNIRIFAVVFLLLFSGATATPEKIEKNISVELTQDQIGVYSFIVKSYRALLKPPYRDMLTKTFYLQEETEPLDLIDLKPGRGCLKGLELEPMSTDKIPTVHRFSQQKWFPSYVKLTSGAPCKGSATAGMCYETEGALSLSEIAFDKSHTHALVGFGVHCGYSADGASYLS
jgi:hypothetical protein